MKHTKKFKVDGLRYVISISLSSSTWQHEKPKWYVEAFVYAPRKSTPCFKNKEAIEMVGMDRISETRQEFVNELLKLPL